MNPYNEQALGVYVHWPFCARLCPYCDFNIYKDRAIDAKQWARALKRDLRHWAGLTPGRRVSSLYFGGGTPSLAPIEVIEAVINSCHDLWGFEDGAEITLEANPTSAERSQFAKLKAAGVNRLSLGVQSLRDDALKFLGRNHNAHDARSAIDAARNFFSRINADFIYARPGQTAIEWGEELNDALDFGITHFSLYQLTIEPGTAFARAVNAGRWRAPDQEACAEQFELTQELMDGAGMPAYEISNHASANAQSRHNLNYWNYRDYIGAGPGAHGRLWANGERIATVAERKPADYLKTVEEKRSGAASIEILSDEAQLIERIMMGLRLKDGITLDADDIFFADEDRTARMNMLIGEGLLVFKDQNLRTTRKGARVLNTVLYALLA